MPVTLFDNDYTWPNQHRFTLHEIVDGFGLGIGLDQYPIFDESYRDTLNQTIYDHFLYRRVAALTPQLFVFYLNRRMREQMPAYNRIYEKLLKTQDPFNTYEEDRSANVQETGEQESASHTDASDTARTTAESLATSTTSNTPASYMENPYDPKYMSSLAQSKNDSSSDADSTSVSDGTSSSNHVLTTDHLSYVRARSGYLGDAVASALATGLLNTDLMVCDMLEPCFMQIWDDQPIF